MKVIVVALGAWSLAGCSATCLRDSDCQGDSVCVKDRCVLVVRGDASAGVSPRPTPAPSGGTGGSGGSGNMAGASGAAGTATDVREILDAASDADGTSP